MPISRRSGATKRPAAASLTIRSPITMRPVSLCSSPAIIRRVVVLPQPDGPSSVSRRPSATASDTSATARTPPKLFPTFSTWTPGIRVLLVDRLRELEHLVLELGVGRAEELELRHQRLRLAGDPALEPAHDRH